MSVLVGRTDERRRAASWLARVRADGRPAALELTGPPGIGKSALATAIADDALAAGAVVRRCGLTEPESVLSWAGLSVLVGGDLDGPVAETTTSPLRRALGREADAAPTEQGSVAFAAAALLRGLTADGPLVVVVDDVQWLDAPTAAALTFAMRSDAPFLFVLSHRSGSLSRIDSARAVPDDRRERVELPGLSVAGVHDVVLEVAGRHPGRHELVRLHELTRGNPMFVRRLAAQLTAPDSSLDRLTVPPDVEAMVARSFDDVDGELLTVLGAVALCGRAEVATVARALGHDIDGSLRAARRRGLVDVRDGVVEFEHPLAQRVILDRIGELDRRGLHRVLAAAIDDPERHAFHLAAGTTDRSAPVAEALHKAADRARALGAADTAADLYRRAIDSLPGDVDSGRLQRWHLDAGNAAFDAASWQTAAEHFDLAYGLGGSPDEREEIAYMRAMATHRFNPLEATEQQLLSVLPDFELHPLQGSRVLSAIAHLNVWKDLPRSLELGSLAVERAEHSGSARQFALAVLNRARAQFLRGDAVDVDAAHAVVARTSDDDRSRLEVILVDLSTYDGQLDRARQHQEAMRDAARRVGDVSLMLAAGTALTTMHMSWGEYGQAAPILAEITELAGLIASEIEISDAAAYAVPIAAMSDGDVDAADAAARSRPHLSPAHDFERRVYRGRAMLALGRIVEAEASLDEAAAIAAGPWGHRDIRFVPIAHNLVECRVRLGQLERAERVATWLDERNSDIGNARSRALGERCHGMIAAARGRREAAVEHFERSMQLHAESPDRFEAACTLLDLGVTLRGLRRRKEAAAALERARDIFVAVGANPYVRRTDDELARLGARPAEAQVASSLTPTETQIAALARRGATNGEIAAQLHVSLRTVESNLTRIYRKLGLRSRTELAASAPVHTEGRLEGRLEG